MKTRYLLSATLIIIAVFFIGCDSSNNSSNDENLITEDTIQAPELTIQEKINEYATVKLTTDISAFTDNDKELIKILMQVSDIMNEIYWDQTWGNKDELFAGITDPDTLKFVELNYGPWDRFRGDEPIIKSIGKKPIGANYYPNDIKYLPFINMKFEDKLSQFTVLRRNDDGELYTMPYHKAYEEQLTKASELLKKAAGLTDNASFKKFLELRADAFLSDDYYSSDLAWMDVNDNKIDFIVGPIECDEDRFINTKTSYEAYLLVKDKEWSEKLQSYIGTVPELIKNIPVEDKYKNNIVGSVSNIGVYDAIYYKGFSNAGGKSISINHPKDGRILMEKGNKKLQFKNVMQAKFDKILYPIAEVLIDESQLKHVKFEAFFENNLFYEISDGLAIKNTVNNTGTVKDAMKELYSTMNGLKADVLRLVLITKLHDMGLNDERELMDNYVTFVADIFRSVRFGTSIFQGEGNMVTFNFFEEQGAIIRNKETGKYSIDFEKMKETFNKHINNIFMIMGDGNYGAAQEMINEKGFILETLKADLMKVSEAGIPRDVTFEQGLGELGLN